MEIPDPLDAEACRQSEVTLAQLVEAVMDVADDERQVTAVVLSMLRRGAVRLRREPLRRRRR